MLSLEEIRARAIEELQRSAAPVPMGMLAVAIGVPTHRLQLALNDLLQRGELHLSAQGWSAPEAERRPSFDDSQPRLDA